MFHSLRRCWPFTLCIPLLAIVLAMAGCRDSGRSSDSAPGGYLFCFWNVENLFDDREDGRERADKEYDVWFARDKQALHLKLERLSTALLKLNEGRGPDILALAEVENVRAAELLRDELNGRLRDESLHYKNLLMKDLSAGRHIAPAILTRLPVRGNKTQLHGRQLRILEGHVEVNGHDLIVLATHWTSRRTDEKGTQRAKYGDQVYGVFKGMYRSNPKVDFLVCGDFNDPPGATSVTEHLRATGNLDAVRQPREGPLLLNLFADKNAEDGWGTHYYKGQWFIFDQIAVSPGLLDEEGWTCDRDSLKTINTLTRPGDRKHRPWRFGEQRFNGERGYSDHFPVTVRLKVNGN